MPLNALEFTKHELRGSKLRNQFYTYITTHVELYSKRQLYIHCLTLTPNEIISHELQSWPPHKDHYTEGSIRTKLIIFSVIRINVLRYILQIFFAITIKNQFNCNYRVTLPI